MTSIEESAFALGNVVALGLFLAAFELRTKTFVYCRTRWLAFSPAQSTDSGEAKTGRLRKAYGEEGASLFLQPSSGRWQFQVNGFVAADISALPARLTHPLTLIESISLMGAQPCYFYAEKAASGARGEWFARLQEYVFALDRAIWRKTISSFIAYHDHTVVVRLISLRHATNIFRAELRNPANRKLASIIAGMQARDLALLLDEQLFDYQGNHGLITSLCLLQYALDLPVDQRPPLVRRVAKWMESREDFFISDDGVPLEISQTYWKLIEQHFIEIQELLNLLGEAATFAKLAKVREFFVHYSIDARVNRFGNSALGHDLHLADSPKTPPDGIVCRIFDTGLFVADFAADGVVRAQLVLNAQDVRPWVHGQQSQMAMGYFSEDTFWVDSPGRFTSGKTGIKARIDSFYNQSVPIREGCGYVFGWKFTDFETKPSGALFNFSLFRDDQALLLRTVEVGRDGSFSITDTAPGGLVETRYLLHPEAQTSLASEALTLDTAGRQAIFTFSGQPTFAEGHISFQRNVALPTKLFCLRGECVRFSGRAPQPLTGELQVFVSSGYPYRKREQIARLHPNSTLQKLSVKKILLMAAVLFGADILLGLIP